MPALYLGTSSGELWMGSEEGAHWSNLARHLPDIYAVEVAELSWPPRSADAPMKVLIPGALQSYTGESRVEAVGDTLEALLVDLDRRYPGLRFRVVNEQDQLRPNLRIFVNGIGVRELHHGLRPDDFVAVVNWRVRPCSAPRCGGCSATSDPIDAPSRW